MKKFEEYIIEKTPTKPEGDFIAYRFPNNRGAMIVRNALTLGGIHGLWEARELRYLSEDGEGCKDDDCGCEHVGDTVGSIVGYLTSNQVSKFLDDIKNNDNGLECRSLKFTYDFTKDKKGEG